MINILFIYCYFCLQKTTRQRHLTISFPHSLPSSAVSGRINYVILLILESSSQGQHYHSAEANWFSMASQFLFVSTMSFYCLFSDCFHPCFDFYMLIFSYVYPSSPFNTESCVGEERGCQRIGDDGKWQLQCQESKVRTMFIIWLY